MRRIYLDNHSATRPFEKAVEAMVPFFRERWGSPLAPHQMGQELFPVLNEGVERILEGLGAQEKDRFYFFASGAEAISHVFLSHYLDSVRHTGKNHIVTTEIEEVPMFSSLKRLEEVGCVSKTLAVNAQGQLTREALEEALKPRTSLVSVSWANALTGVIHPIADLAAVCKEKDVRLHVDASYVIGRLYFRFEDLPIDFLTFEGNLLHAPKGTAGLLVKEKTLFSPALSSLLGASVGGIAALAEAVEEDVQEFDHLCLETARLRDKLEVGIVKGFAGADVLFAQAERLPHCSAMVFPGVVGEALQFLLHRKGVYASVGGGQSQKLSSVLMACGVEEMLAQSALSFSLSYETTEEEIDAAIEMIVHAAHQLRKLSEQVMQ